MQMIVKRSQSDWFLYIRINEGPSLTLLRNTQNSWYLFWEESKRGALGQNDDSMMFLMGSINVHQNAVTYVGLSKVGQL